MRGIIETTRGATTPREQSRIVQYNATEADLATARQTYIGQRVLLRHDPSLRFHCVDVRLDQLHRLIFDLIRQDTPKQPKGSEVRDGNTRD
jgi:hypothetical protein